MQAPFELTEGLQRLKKIIESFPPHSPYWHEAENRFQFVDRLLTECLGWERPWIRVEVTDGAGGRADYILGQPARAVVEVKREAKHFDAIPTGKPTAVRKLAPILRASKNFEDAAHQVLRYCVVHGATLAVVCNGPQLAIFQALTPGYPPLEGECYFFDGISSYIEHFTLLWTLLSPDGIAENRAARELARHRTPRIPPKAVEFIPQPDQFRYRTEFQENIRILASLLLEEVEDNPALKSEFYRECYVPLEANNRHLLLSKRIIAARYRRVGGDGVAPSALESVAKPNREGDLVLDEATLRGAAGARPIVVIGDVGVGKTSFFKNLYENLEQSEKARTYFLHIDLGIKATLSDDIKSYVLTEIPKMLKEKYEVDIESREFVNAVYHREIKGFDSGVWGALKEIDATGYTKEKISFLARLIDNKGAHLLASLGHLSKGRNKQIILVIDNADQRNLDVQQDAFLIAQELAATRNLLVFVALRPSTFYQSKMTGALSGYQHKILTISPPPADEVVQRRLAFAIRVAKGQVAPAALENIRLQLGNVVSFFSATLRSIRTNEEIRSFLSNITGGNTRGVIELITGFFGSPNVDSEKIVRIEQTQGNYKVPLHEFTKHALLGEYAYFNAHSSQVACNILDVSAPDPREHFLCSLIVSYLSSPIGSRDEGGFMSGGKIIEEMAKNGFAEDQARYAIRRLAAKRLIETPHAHYRELQVPDNRMPDEFHFRVTSVGVYHIRFWTGTFAFLDATATDTPIFDEAVRDEVARLAPSFDIRDRFRKACLFREYLRSQWQLANIGASYYDFLALVQQGDKSFEAVERAITKPSQRKRPIL